MQLEPDDINLIADMVDKRGWSEVSKAAKFIGAWKGMVFKRGSFGIGYYRDEFKLDLKLAMHLTAVADAAPVAIQLEGQIASKPVEEPSHDDEPETCPKRRRTSTGRKSKGGGLEFEWPSDDSLAANSTFHVPQGIGPSTPSTAVVGRRRRDTLPKRLLTFSQFSKRRPWRTALRTQNKLPGTRAGKQRSPRAS